MWKDTLVIILVMTITVGLLTCTPKAHADVPLRRGVCTADHITLPCILVDIKGVPTVILFQNKRVYAVFQFEAKDGKLVPKLIFQYKVII